MRKCRQPASVFSIPLFCANDSIKSKDQHAQKLSHDSFQTRFRHAIASVLSNKLYLQLRKEDIKAPADIWDKNLVVVSILHWVECLSSKLLLGIRSIAAHNLRERLFSNVLPFLNQSSLLSLLLLNGLAEDGVWRQLIFYFRQSSLRPPTAFYVSY